jgi:hypothetical protein
MTAQTTAQKTVSDRDQQGRFTVGNDVHRSGARTKAARLVALYADLAADYGGEDRLTAAGRLLLEQAARLKLQAERARGSNDAVRLANAAARLLRKVTCKPEALTPSRKYRAPSLRAVRPPNFHITPDVDAIPFMPQA